MKRRIIFFVLLLFATISILAQPFTKKFIMAFHTCGSNCFDPRNHNIRLAESNDGVLWSLVPNFQTYSGSVPDVIIRGSKLYIYDAGNVTVYDRSTNTWAAKSTFQITDGSGNIVRPTDPSLFIDDQGRINLFFLNSTGLIGDPAGCASYPCTKIFDSAVEIPGSDGKSFIAQPGHRATIVLNSGAASDPDIFYDGVKYIMYISMGQSTAAYSSTTLHDSYNPIIPLPNGMITDQGGVPCGYFDPTTSKYWTYVNRKQPDGNMVINLAVHDNFNSQLQLANFVTVISGKSIGLDPWVYAESPGFCVNDFYSLPQLPPPVELVSPTNTSTQTETMVKFVWKKPAGDIIKYWLEISESSNFSSSKIDSSLSDTTATNICQIGKQYWWQVKAKNNAGWGLFSEARNFSIGSLPAQVQLLLPSNGLLNIPTSVEFKWNSVASASSYQLQLSTQQDFSNLFFDENTITGTSKTINGLQNYQKYYWRVRAINSLGNGLWSIIFNFTTMLQLPSQVILVSPQNNSVVTQSNVALKWNISLPAIDRYELEYADNINFTNSIMDSNVPVADKTITVSPNKSYCWKVRAHNAAGWGLFSEVWKFTVNLTNIDEQTLPTTTKLFQNHPNPFNGETKISFNLSVDCYVKMVIHNILGMEVATLLNKKLKTGTYFLTWSPGKIPSAIYICHFSTPAYQKRIKIIYMK